MTLAHVVATPVSETIDRAGPLEGEVMGSWPAAAYLDFDGFVVAVTGRRVPLMPNGIGLGEPTGLEWFRRGADVSLSRSEVRSGGIRIALAGAHLWDPSVPINRDRADYARRGRDILSARGGDATVAGAARGLSLSVPPDVLRLLETALRDLDADAAGNAAAGLTGWGPGLTPEGDDVLAGCVAALRAHPEGSGRGLCEVLAGCSHATTPLSATMLRLAAHGQTMEPIVRILDLDAAEWRPALDRLLSIGHSTGRAYALGCGAAAALLGAGCLQGSC